VKRHLDDNAVSYQVLNDHIQRHASNNDTIPSQRCCLFSSDPSSMSPVTDCVCLSVCPSVRPSVRLLSVPYLLLIRSINHHEGRPLHVSCRGSASFYCRRSKVKVTTLAYLCAFVQRPCRDVSCVRCSCECTCMLSYVCSDVNEHLSAIKSRRSKRTTPTFDFDDFNTLDDVSHTAITPAAMNETSMIFGLSSIAVCLSSTVASYFHDLSLSPSVEPAVNVSNNTHLHGVASSRSSVPTTHPSKNCPQSQVIHGYGLHRPYARTVGLHVTSPVHRSFVLYGTRNSLPATLHVSLLLIKHSQTETESTSLRALCSKTNIIRKYCGISVIIAP